MKKISKKLFSCILAITLIIGQVLITPTTNVEAATVFKPRLTAPSKSDKNYYSNRNVFHKAGYGLPNCTAYAYGRAYELLGKAPKVSSGHAYKWWAYNKDNKAYPYGKTPKLGAIAVWNKYEKNAYGHVAVVEEIKGNDITFSESQYNGKKHFATFKLNKNNMTYYGNKNFLGYIYIGDFVTKNIALNSIKLNKTNATLLKGDTLELITTLSPSNATNTLTWSSNNTKVATVDSNGIVTAKTNGTAVITIKSNNNKTATCKVTVKNPSSNPEDYPVPTRPIYYKNPTMKGNDVRYVQSALKKLGYYKGEIDGSFGPSCKEATAKFQKDNKMDTDGSMGPATLKQLQKVLKGIKVTSVKLNKTSITLNKGKSTTLTATVAPSNATNKNVTWSSNNTKVATVDSKGTVKAVGKGTAKITVKTKDGSKTATCQIKVNDLIQVSSIKLSKTSATLWKEETLNLKATVAPSNATNKNVIWSSSNTKVATVDSNGVVTAKASGTATITVKSNNNKTTTCKVTVKNPSTNPADYPVPTRAIYYTSPTMKGNDVRYVQSALKKLGYYKGEIDGSFGPSCKEATSKFQKDNKMDTDGSMGPATLKQLQKVLKGIKVTSVKLNKTSITLNKGKSTTLTATVAPSNATNKNVTWSSNNTKVATVDSKGTVKAINKGTAIITVKTKDGSKTATCKITVK